MEQDPLKDVQAKLCKDHVTVDYLPELVELYEYKVDDLVAGRHPRGGRHALNDLRQALLSAELDPILMRRLIASDRQYRTWRRAEQAESTPAEAAAPHTPFQWANVAAEPDEASVMGLRLKTLAWHAQSTEYLGQMTRDLRHEPQRPTLRLLYAVTENAERGQRGISARFSVPTADDPLVSLGNKEVVEEITDNLADLLLTPEGRQLVMSTLSDVRENPFPLHPAEVELRAQLAAAEREPMTAQAREELVAALRAQHPKAPDPRERPAIREASVRLQRLLEEQWRTLPDDQAVPQILFAPSAHTLIQPDDHAAELLIYLAAQQQETCWRGLTIRWQSVGPNWQLQIGQQLLMLYPHLSAKERRAALINGKPSVQAFYEGNYVLLKVNDDAHAALGALASQARAVALLLHPSEAYANLRLARAAAQELRGMPLNLPALTPESAEKFGLAAPNDLQDFVRQGLETLMARTEKLTPEEVRQSLRRCAAALRMPDSRVDKLHESLHNAIHNPDDVSALALPAVPGGTRLLRSGGHFQSFQMTGEPMTIGIKDRAVTLRWDYKNDLMALIPGLPSLQINDLLVVPLSDLDLMFVRQGTRVALAAVAHQTSLEDVGLD